MVRNVTIHVRVLRGLIEGIAVGIGMILPVWYGHAYAVPTLGRLHEAIHLPARCLAVLWSDVFRLPPHGEAAWIFVPPVAVVLQWIVLCVAIEMAVLLVQRNRHAR
jgi:hypothetical protein